MDTMNYTITIIIAAVLLLFILVSWQIVWSIHTYFSAPTQSRAFQNAEIQCFKYMGSMKGWFLFWLFAYIIFRTLIDRNHEWKNRFWE
jgi:hypothetical protein